MNSKSSNSNKTIIKLLYMLLIASSLVYATAWAAGPGGEYKSDAQVKAELCAKPPYLGYDNEQSCLKSELSKNKDMGATCEKQEDNLTKGIEAMQDICGRLETDDKGNFKSAKNCHTRLNKCVGNITDGPSGVAGALAALTGQTATESREACSETKQSWRSQSEKYENQLEKQSEKVKTETEAIAKIDEDVNKEYKSMSEKMKQNQKDYKKLVKETESEAAKSEEDALTAEIKAGETLRSINAAKAKARQDLDDVMYKADMEMLNAAKEASELDCTSKVEERIEPMIAKKRAMGAKSLDTLRSSSSELQKMADTIWLACMKGYQKRRENVSAMVDRAKASYDRSVEDLEAREQAANKIMKQQTEARTLRLQQQEVQRQEGLKEAIQNNQMMAAEMTSLQKTSMQRKMASQQRLLQAQMQANATIGKLNALGYEPSSNSTDNKSLSELLTKLSGYQQQVSAYAASECCTGSSPRPQCASAKNFIKEKLSVGGSR